MAAGIESDYLELEITVAIEEVLEHAVLLVLHENCSRKPVKKLR